MSMKSSQTEGRDWAMGDCVLAGSLVSVMVLIFLSHIPDQYWSLTGGLSAQCASAAVRPPRTIARTRTSATEGGGGDGAFRMNAGIRSAASPANAERPVRSRGRGTRAYTHTAAANIAASIV